jgi:tyrosine-protein phosphatase non-receptor type 9
MTVDQLLDHVIKIGSHGLNEEFKEIRSKPIVDSYNIFKEKENLQKNRYRDVFCLDESRVKLRSDEVNDFYFSDYIHANYVDGYRQKNAYISTQGPLDETLKDFWQMIWQETILVIAMTTKVIEQKKLKCFQYWPLEKGESMKIENSFEIINDDVDDLGDYRVTKLIIKNLRNKKSRNIVHCQFLSWPDHGVPKTSLQILEFIEMVRQYQQEKLNELPEKWAEHPLGPPICVHCSAGIGRTGTFLSIDISVNKLKDCNKVDIEETVNKIRLQRAQSVQMRDQYVFCYMAVLEFAKREKLFLTHSNIDLESIFERLL